MKGAFKQIRKDLLTNNKFNRYLLYALGEVALVVVGILMAISIDDWLKDRNNRQDEQYYLGLLKEEFEFNQASLLTLMELNKDITARGREILKYAGPATPAISEMEFDSLLVNTLGFEVQFRPRSEIIDEVISSGKLSLFRNNALRTLLASWSGTMTGLRFQEEELSRYRFQLLDLTMKKVNMRDAAFHGTTNFFGTGASLFIGNNTRLLQEQEFESVLTYFIATSTFTELKLVNIQERIQTILTEIDSARDSKQGLPSAR